MSLLSIITCLTFATTLYSFTLGSANVLLALPLLPTTHFLFLLRILPCSFTPLSQLRRRRALYQTLTFYSVLRVLPFLTLLIHPFTRHDVPQRRASPRKASRRAISQLRRCRALSRRKCECSGDVYLRSLHSAHANLTVNMHLHTLQVFTLKCARGYTFSGRRHEVMQEWCPHCAQASSAHCFIGVVSITRCLIAVVYTVLCCVQWGDVTR
jgi:hypothetical protein